MAYIPGQSVEIQRTTQNATGTAVDADSLPTAEVIKNGDLDATPTVTVTDKGVGQYELAWTIPSAYSTGDTVEIRMYATVSGVAGSAIVFTTVLEIAKTFVLGPVVGAPSAANLVGTAIPLAMFRAELKIFNLTHLDDDGDPVDLSGMTLRFVVETTAQPPVEKFNVATSEITVTGNGNEIANCTISAAKSDITEGDYQWRLWDDSVPQILLFGGFDILPAS